MKKYRVLMPVVMIGLMLASWYLLIEDSVETENTYTNYISAARKYAEDGITKYAIDNYNHALEIKSSPEIYDEVAKYYYKQGDDQEYLSWCETFLEAYPTESMAYEDILTAYLEDKDYESCFDILATAEKREISSKYMKEVSEEIQYVYKLDFNTFEDVSTYSNHYCPVKNKDLWGFVDRYGVQRVSCRYAQVGAFTQSNLASVMETDDNIYFIDKRGSKVLVSKEEYQKFGLIVDGKIAVQMKDGTYAYTDQDFNVLFGKYDYASTINNNVAAVKIENSWQLIDADGKSITEDQYADVKLDEKQIAYRNDRAFVALTDGKYSMIDGSGKRIGDLEFQDAKVFLGNEPTAVKIDGSWCFVNADGKLISDKKYDDARAFSNGLAAVCIDGKWGFVDTNENVVIEPVFFGAKDFNEKGSCFVKTGDKWQLLKLYRLNREE